MKPESIVKPTKYRRQHGRIERVGETMQDAAGDIGHPFRAEGLLANLERRGDIDGKQRQAGEEFHRLFQLAALDPLRASDVARTRISGSRHAQSGSEAARWQIRRALEALGEPAGSCCWYVIGCEQSMREFTRRVEWCGRTMREEVAKGTLISALGVLVRHFEKQGYM